jgi:hypothetical protein
VLFDAFEDWWSMRNEDLLAPQSILPIEQLQQAREISDDRSAFLPGVMARRHRSGAA